MVKHKHRAPIVPVHAPAGGAGGAGGAGVSKGPKQQPGGVAKSNGQHKQQPHHQQQQPQQQQPQQQQHNKQHPQKQHPHKQHQQQDSKPQQQPKQQVANGKQQHRPAATDLPPAKKQKVDSAAGGHGKELQQKRSNHGDGHPQQHKQKQKQKQAKEEQAVVQQQPQTDGQQQQQQAQNGKPKKRKRGKGGAAPAGDGTSAAPKIDAARVAAAARAAPGSNWQALKQQLAEQAAQRKPRRPRPGGFARGSGGATGDAGATASAAAAKKIGNIGSSSALTRVMALDCEFVGVGPGGEMDALARVSVVNDEGNVLLDTFVEVKERVTDYRTWVSGVRPQDLVGAPSLEDVRERVAKMVEGRTLVGHSLSKDMKVLMLSHPRKDIRDTANRGGKRRPQALRQLAKKELGLEIQTGEHSSVDDARAALYLYHKHRKEWERAARAGAVSKLPTAGQVARKHASYGARDVRDDPMADL